MGSRKENITIPSAFMRDHEVGERLVTMLEDEIEVLMHTEEEEVEPSCYWKLLNIERQLKQINTQLTAGHQPNLVDVERQLEQLEYAKNNLVNFAQIELTRMAHDNAEREQLVLKNKE